MSIIKKLLHLITGFFPDNGKEDGGQTKPPTDEEIINQAHSDLLQAQHLFTLVTDQEMIDYAIYLLNASEIRYDYLIRSLKKSSYSFDL